MIVLCCRRTNSGSSCIQGHPRDVSISGGWDAWKTDLWQCFKTVGFCLQFLLSRPDFSTCLFFGICLYRLSRYITLHCIVYFILVPILKSGILGKIKMSIFMVQMHIWLKCFRDEPFFFFPVFLLLLTLRNWCFSGCHSEKFAVWGA